MINIYINKEDFDSRYHLPANGISEDLYNTLDERTKDLLKKEHQDIIDNETAYGLGKWFDKPNSINIENNYGDINIT